MNAPSAASWPYPLTPWHRPVHYKDRTSTEPLVSENTFIGRMPDRALTKTFAESRALLPIPNWDGHGSAIDGYWRAWDLAFRNLRRAPLETGFITPFIDTAFNDCLFMWDTCFILMWARYGERAFPFQKTLDNFYAKQHPSGFICREIREWSGEDYFHYSDPNSTGPNLLAWPEWEYFEQFGDRERLAAVFPPLVAFYRWMKKNRTWPDGTYWSTGWGCGMDNQSRLSPGANPKWDHDHLSWIDTTAQAIFSARLLIRMAEVLGREKDVADLPTEIEQLSAHVNTHMWNAQESFYVDRRRDGSLSNVKSIAGFWPLAAGIVPPDRRDLLLAHLDNPKTFRRPHPVPSISADNPNYRGEAGGDYWLGGVWPPTNYMILRALTANGFHAEAHRLARAHHDYVTQVYEKTGTYWENYSPEQAVPGKPAMGDFLGWGGLGPITVFLEYVIGLRPDFSTRSLLWDIRLTEAHGIKNYPFGKEGVVDLKVAVRANQNAEPSVEVRTNQPLTLVLRWHGGTRTIDVPPTTPTSSNPIL